MMDHNEKLVDYIKKGLEKGFSKAHIKEILLNHKYRPAEIEMAFALVGGSSHKKKRKLNLKSLAPFGYVGATVFIMLLLFAVLVQSGKEKPSALMEVQRETIENQIKEIDVLKSSIDSQQAAITSQLRMIRNLNITADDKQGLILEQITKLEELNTQISEERQKVRSLLIEVINSMFKRSAVYAYSMD